MFSMRKFCLHTLTISLAIFFASSSNVIAGVETSFLYNLSNFSGPIPYNWAHLFVDQQRNEIYVVDPVGKDVTIFNDKGMEIYRFADDGSLGNPVDVAVKEDGNLLVLTRVSFQPRIILCQFRGEPLSTLELKNFPADYSNFSPDRMVYRQGRLYLLESQSKRLAVTGANGLFETGYDLDTVLDIEEKMRAEAEIGGFSVDREGNMLFTIPVLFSAYKLSPDGEATRFGGRGGGSPGSFGIVGGIVEDDLGYYYVADRLKHVVLVFDKNFRFQREFGYRGPSPENLIGPRNLALDAEGRLYVSQLRSRGISVFKITHTPQATGTN
jgi:hypothetical protein